jgi:hypothetical protein
MLTKASCSQLTCIRQIKNIIDRLLLAPIGGKEEVWAVSHDHWNMDNLLTFVKI